MQLMQLAEVPLEPGHRVFRHSLGRAVFTIVGISLAIAALLIYGRQQSSGLAYYLAGALLLGTLVMHKFISARFLPSNWLLRMNDEGLFIQFRSYLNCHFPATDYTVVFIHYHEIRSIWLVNEHSEIPYRDLDRPLAEESTEWHRRFIEFDLLGDTSLLANALAAEHAKRPANATLYKDYPVRLSSPGRVQVAWKVAPGSQVFLDAMRKHTMVTNAVEKYQDFTNLKGLSRKEQEDRLLELLDAGQTIDAVYIARKLYGYNLPEARDFVEGLRSDRNVK